MSRLWPTKDYAEDQPYPRAILATHVLTRGAQVGALGGLAAGFSIVILRHFNVLKATPATSTSAVSLPSTKPTAAAKVPTSALTSSVRSATINTLLRSTGVGFLLGTGILSVGLSAQMRGKEAIEWKDRSWRLLRNKGQLECDDWSYGGMILGVASAVRQGVPSQGAITAIDFLKGVGRVGVGGTVGLLGYMGWRYGLMGGWKKERV